MIQYDKYTEYNKKQFLELFLNILKIFNEKQVKQYKGFIPFNFKFYKEKVNSIRNLDFNSLQLKKLSDGVYRFYLNDNELFSGVQKVFDRKLEREYNIINYGIHYFDFSIFPMTDINNSDEQYLNQEIDYTELMERKNYLDIDYYYVNEKLYLLGEISNEITDKGRINDLTYETINYMNKFKIDFKNIIQNNEDTNENGNQFELIFLQLYKQSFYVYTIPIKQLFDKLEDFDLTFLRKIHSNVNVFDNELNELISLINIQKYGKTPSSLYGTDQFTLVDTKTIDELGNQKFYLFDDKVEISFRFSNDYDITDVDQLLLITPYVVYFKNLDMLNPNFLETSNNMKVIQKIDGGSF